MISFKRWALSGKLDARQADDYTAEFRVSGLLPGYTWELLWNYGSNLDVIPLELNDGGDIGIATLTKDNLAFSGTYVAQLRATTPNGGIKHTDKLELNISDSFTEDAHWPIVPRAFSEYVEGVADDVANEINARIKPPFFATVSHTPYADVVAAYEAKRFIVAVDSTGDTYAMIHHEPGQRFEFGGLNPITGQAKYWELRYEDGHNVWATGTKNYARSNTIDTSYSIPTCKAVYDALTKYYDKTVVDNAIAAAKATAAQALADHNADALAHPAIRQIITELANRLNALADSDDATLDQLSEIVAYIKSNKSLIDIVTTSKVSVSDIINNLTSTATNKPLSAAQGAVLKAAVDALEAEVEASKVIVIDADNLPDNAYNVVAAAFPSNRLCCMHVSITNVKYLFLQDAVYGEDYFTFSAVGRNGKLIKRKLFRDNTLSPSEISDLSNVFVGDDNTTYSEWRTHIDAGKACVWRSSDYLGFDYAYIGMVASGTLLFNAIEYTLALTLEISPSGTKSLSSYSIPSKPAPSEAGYVLTATATGSATWAPPTGGSGGDSNTVVFDKNNVTYDAVAEAFRANKAVNLVYEYNTTNYLARCYKIGSQDAYFVGGIEESSDTYIIHQVIVYNTNAGASAITVHEIEVPTPYSLQRMIQDAPTSTMLVLAHTDTGYGIFAGGGEDAGGLIPVSYENLMSLIMAKSLLLLDEEALAVYRFDKIDPTTQAIVFSRTDGNTTSTITMAADNTVTVAESEITYTKDQIDAALGAYITDIDALIGGDS